MSKGKLVIIGGGKSRYVTLGKLAGYHTTVLTRKPEKWSLDVGLKMIKDTSIKMKSVQLLI